MGGRVKVSSNGEREAYQCHQSRDGVHNQNGGE